MHKTAVQGEKERNRKSGAVEEGDLRIFFVFEMQFASGD